MAEELTLGETKQEAKPEEMKTVGGEGQEVPNVPERQVEQAEQSVEQAEGTFNEILSKAGGAAKQVGDDTDTDTHQDAKSIADVTDAESKVQKLVDLAGTKGVVHAVSVARKLKDYYVLDKMHDELADKFYQGLVEKGLIKSE